jgi:hypothetical protein
MGEKYIQHPRYFKVVIFIIYVFIHIITFILTHDEKIDIRNATYESEGVKIKQINYFTSYFGT